MGGTYGSQESISYMLNHLDISPTKIRENLNPNRDNLSKPGGKRK